MDADIQKVRRALLASPDDPELQERLACLLERRGKPYKSKRQQRREKRQAEPKLEPYAEGQPTGSTYEEWQKEKSHGRLLARLLTKEERSVMNKRIARRDRSKR